MSRIITFKDFDIVERFDGSWAIYDYAWWPDDYLDSNPELNALYLETTGGWRAKGWILVQVCPTLQTARNWCYNHAGE